MSELDRNGNARESFDASVYCYDANSGLFTSLFTIRIIQGSGLPPHSTLEVPPEVNERQTVRFNGRAWELVNDFRGLTQYHTVTQAESVVDYVGDIDPEHTLDKPTNPYDKWNGITWVVDEEAKRQYGIEQIKAQRQRLLQEVLDTTRDWKTELELGIITDEDKAALTAWMKYAQALKAMEPEADTAFPVKPE